VVQLTVPDPEHVSTSVRGLAPVLPTSTFHYYNVAVAAPDKAVEAAIKSAKHCAGVSGRAVRALSKTELAALGLSAGHVKSA
jgi:hypothetical protein